MVWWAFFSSQFFFVHWTFFGLIIPNYWYLINTRAHFSSISYAAACAIRLGVVIKSCEMVLTLVLWCRWTDTYTESKRNQIGSKLQDLVYQNIFDSILLNRDLCDIFILRRTFKLDGQHTLCAKKKNKTGLGLPRLLIKNLFFDYLQISRRRIMLDRQVNWMNLVFHWCF